MGLRRLRYVVLIAFLCVDLAVVSVSAYSPHHPSFVHARLQADAGDIPGALITARSIRDHWWRALTLIHIADLQTTTGDPAGAARSLTEARAAALSIGEGPWRDRTLSDIARAQVTAGDIPGALTTVRSIRIVDSRAEILGSIATAQTQAGDISGALITARSIGNDASRARALVSIAEAQEKAGDLGGAARSTIDALIAARGIAEANDRGRVLSRIAIVRAKFGDIPGALAVAWRIRDDEHRTRALAGIAEAQEKADDP